VSLLLGILNARLGLPCDKLPSLHRLDSVSGDQVRWVHAPPQPPDDQRTALGQHTDFGSVTILFNRLGGLQVLPPNTEEWCFVKPLRGHAVVNLGDAMVKFTAGILRSNTHRVVNPPGQQAEHTRMSLVYFARPADEVILKALDGSALIEEKKEQSLGNLDEEEITSKEWILRRALGRRQGGDWAKSEGTEHGESGK
jgi:isopenicillin N synthase-like dioxygenase